MSKHHFLGSRSISVCVLILFISAIAGCNNYSAPGGGGGNPAITVSPSPLSFPAIGEGTTSGPTAITVTNPGTSAVTISSVAFGGANVADFTNTNACTGSVAPKGTCAINVTFAPMHSGMLAETVTITQNGYAAPQVVNVSGTANPIAITLTPNAASAMAAGQTMQFAATGDPNGVTWSVAGFTNSGMGTSAPAGTIDASGNFMPPAGSSIYAVVTATGKTDPANKSSATVNVVAPGTFANTNNVQVAQYSVSAPSPANISVQFGLDTNYGLTTWTVPTGSLGGQPSTPLYVAGMKQSTAYHMRGVIAFNDGSSFNDADATFTTGVLPAGTVPTLTATTTAGMTPQPGVELLDLVDATPTGPSPAVATDLAGNVIWSYNPSLAANVLPEPIKLLSNGHFLIGFSSSIVDGQNAFIQEVDLGSNVIWQMTSAQLNTALTAATCAECNVTVIGTHHDFQVLPNGHILVIASTQQTVTGTLTTGDVIIDLGDMENVGGNNPNHTPQPVWAWNEFNHLDTSRRPFSFPDWTHTNAILYSKDDGNIIISSRHQNWLVKIDYNNGAGVGDIIWKMGAILPTDTTAADKADFTLLNADGTPDTTATDWFFAQHGPSFTTSNTTGSFGLTLFDNGDDRGAAVVAGGTCGVSGQPACFSTVPVLTVDETAKTATLMINPTTPDYSFFGGNAETLANGDLEFDEASTTPLPSFNAAIFEMTQANPPQTVWQMKITGQFAYRGFRMGSLYPGVQW